MELSMRFLLVVVLVPRPRNPDIKSRTRRKDEDDRIHGSGIRRVPFGTERRLLTLTNQRSTVNHPPPLKLQQPGFDAALALNLDGASRLEHELVLQLLVDGSGYLDRVGHTARFHAAC